MFSIHLKKNNLAVGNLHDIHCILLLLGFGVGDILRITLLQQLTFSVLENCFSSNFLLTISHTFVPKLVNIFLVASEQLATWGSTMHKYCVLIIVHMLLWQHHSSLFLVASSRINLFQIWIWHYQNHKTPEYCILLATVVCVFTKRFERFKTKLKSQTT